MRSIRPLGRLGAALLVLVSLPTAASQVSVGDDVSFDISGTVQPRVSGAQQDGVVESERFGVGLRRARFQMRATFQDRIGFEFDFDGSPGDVRSVDLYGFYKPTDQIEIRAGRQPGAQPRSYVPTSHSRIDAVERAAIAERWAGGTIGSSGRDIGVDVDVTTDHAKAVLFVHSGTGSFAREDGNFRESITASSVTRDRDEVGVAVTAMASVEPPSLPGVEVGAFAGVNPVGSDESALDGVARTYTTGGAHLYWGADPGSQPVRVKLDALGIRYQEVGGERQEAVGVAGFAAIGVQSVAEVFGRVEPFWTDLDGDPDLYVTAGGSYSLSAARGGRYRTARLTLAYATRSLPLGDDAGLAVLQGQFAF